MNERDEAPLPSEHLTPAAALVIRGLRALQAYHRHSAIAVHAHVPKTGPALIVTNHSLATYDAFLLALAIYDATGRLPTGLADDLLFELPFIRDWSPQIFMMPASPRNGARLLEAGRLVYVAPGGMKEALRSREERYAVQWENRKGFIRLALRTGAPIVLAACPAADDVFTVYRHSLTDRMYARFKLPLPLFRGVGPSLIPRPITLTHRVAAPIVPPPWDEAREDAQVEALHARVVEVMTKLMARTGSSPVVHDRT
ncbi:MAG: acyltransferase family protein [Deltaproteobacteria bacterium]|nr:acyltransferase family protein [Deltaproteobacteria bacterium]